MPAPVRWLTLVAALLVLIAGLGCRPPGAWAADPASQQGEAVLAGGCFWCLEHDLESLTGVLDVVSGYSGGHLERPTYRQVSAGGSGHQESVRVRFDPGGLRYEELLRAYWRNVDPLDDGGQFCDRGTSYRPVIFTADAEQRRLALASRRAAALELGLPESALKVQIRPQGRFWPAEDHHQNYAERNPLRYGYYRWACGRDRRLEAVWGTRARSALPWAAALGPSGPRS
ncbi:MAG: peptide-methionine (S)-S-oxide reductase MsrA [Cyanobium sp. Prado107]|jgi:peptide-methionine (S)-S-oxide reductase|nr:peptide-methionine (S)-S-oxide reductase MsrA [Cyanobium sp. Prado107]